jgi:hypothetical protein
MPATHSVINGHRALSLESDLLRVTVLPDKGADVYELFYKPLGIDCLLKTPAGLQPPADHPPADFLSNYEGGWQELLPNIGDPCEHRGRAIPFHGEVALLPWRAEIVADSDAEVAARFTVESCLLPLRLTRTMRLPEAGDVRARDGVLMVDETIENCGREHAFFTWGHHIVLGAPFLEEGCWLEAAARTLFTPFPVYEPVTAAVAGGQRGVWPLARRAAPGRTRVDLRRIPGPAAHTHDDVILTDFERGSLAVNNPRLGLAFHLEWDAGLFRYAMLWMPYGGADLPPLTGIYGLGVEPWASPGNLAQALEQGDALMLEPGQKLATKLQVTLKQKGS